MTECEKNCKIKNEEMLKCVEQKISKLKIKFTLPEFSSIG